jgi:hypothetical protein
MIRRIAGVAVGVAVLAGLAGAAAGVAVAGGVRITDHNDGREWSSPGGSIFTVHYGMDGTETRDFSVQDQATRDQ